MCGHARGRVSKATLRKGTYTMAETKAVSKKMPKFIYQLDMPCWPILRVLVLHETTAPHYMITIDAK